MSDPHKVPSGDSVWALHWEFVFADAEPGAVVRLATPIDSPTTRLFEQNISMQNMRIRRSRALKDGTRELVAQITGPAEEASLSIEY
ncbi:MAG: hypothetical protein R3240_03765, partial [Gammaproteobacteria bacterium]|nr:hypothetical protein [Gammaproteobacteria bacterium]